MSYTSAKSLLKKALPKQLLFRLEPAIRYIHSLSLAGNRYMCNVCGVSHRDFIHHGGDRICPRCGSIERVRRLWQILQQGYLPSNPRILDFSPSRSLYRKLSRLDLDYTASDLSGDFVADVAWDITEIPAADQSFDLIICYHVLEHVPDDRKAMSELFRVLAHGGTCLVQTPFGKDGIYEDPSIVSPEQRRVHFGQEDHVRVYSAEGLAERLREAGFKVEIRDHNGENHETQGLRSGERILFCCK